SDFEDDLFSQLDQQGQPVGEASVALRNDSLRSDMSLGRSSDYDIRGSSNSSVSVAPLNPHQPQYEYRIPAHEPLAEMGIDEVRAALIRIDNDNPLADFEVPVRGLDERAIPLGSLSQESYSSGMNVDSPAGSQAGVSAYSVPIQ
ncbi:unnamed protein product, partial [Allacma fusca]